MPRESTDCTDGQKEKVCIESQRMQSVDSCNQWMHVGSCDQWSPTTCNQWTHAISGCMWTHAINGVPPHAISGLMQSVDSTHTWCSWHAISGLHIPHAITSHRMQSVSVSPHALSGINTHVVLGMHYMHYMRCFGMHYIHCFGAWGLGHPVCPAALVQKSNPRFSPITRGTNHMRCYTP